MDKTVPYRWIFGSGIKDFFWIFFPGLVALSFSPFLDSFSQTGPWIWYAFIIRAVIDSGHVFTTVWRTYFNKEERQSHLYYWLIPATIFTTLLLWQRLNFRYLWEFVVYSTLFHNVRQFYGTNKWYQKNNLRFCALSDFFMYALCLIPVFIMHVRTDGVVDTYYSKRDLFVFPNTQLEHVGYVVFYIAVFSWVAFEIHTARKLNKIEWNRIFGIFVPGALYAGGFLFGHSSLQIVGPSVASHGISYFGMMSLALTREGKPLRLSFRKWLFLIVMTAVFFGSLESLFENTIIDFPDYDVHQPPNWISTLLICFYLTPLFCHYALDAIIWRYRHRVGKVIFTHS